MVDTRRGVNASTVRPRWPLTSKGSSMKMKGAKTMLSKKHCKTTQLQADSSIIRLVLTSNTSEATPGSRVFFT